MDYRFERSAYWGVASRLTVLAHLFGILAFILMLVWLLHFRGGIDYESYYHEQVFNVHPFLMFCGFIFLVGQAMMAYKTVFAEHRVQRFVHMLLHLIAIILGIVGICAAFKYHDMLGAGDLYTLHSWIGIGTFCLFGLQWLFGLFTFMGGRDLTTMREMLPWHKSGGRALLYMAVCAALTGLMQKSIYPIPRPHPESHLINFTGLFILLFGIFVDLSVSLGHYIS